MKKILSFLMLALALALSLPALAEDVLYTGMVTRAMTIREKKSTSAKKLGSVEEGEFISIIDYGEKWTKIEKDGQTGYILDCCHENPSKPKTSAKRFALRTHQFLPRTRFN